MSAPVGFNPNASLLPDPGSSVPIETMRGGGSNITKAPVEVVGEFSPEELTELALYQLGPGGVIEHDIDFNVKKEFLKEIKDKARCRRTTGDTIVLGKDCWAIVKVTRALLRAKVSKTNRSAPLPAPLKTKVNAKVGTSPLIRQDGKRNLETGRPGEGGPENGFSNNGSNGLSEEDENERQMGRYERNRLRNRQNNSEGRVALGIHNVPENEDNQVEDENHKPSTLKRQDGKRYLIGKPFDPRNYPFNNDESDGNDDNDRSAFTDNESNSNNNNARNKSRPSPCVRVLRKNRSNSGSNNNSNSNSNNESNCNNSLPRNTSRPSPCVRVLRKNRCNFSNNESNSNNKNAFSNNESNGEENNEEKMKRYENDRQMNRNNDEAGRLVLGIENENENENNNEAKRLFGIQNNNENSENENTRNQGDVDKIEELDNWVLENYDNKIGKEEYITYYGKKDSSYIKPLTGGQSKYNPLIKKWKTVVTYGDGHCLIHALFTSLLPSYRRITYGGDRGKAGETFRKNEFADLFEGDDKKFVEGNKFLEEKHLDMFVNTYKINVLVLRNVGNGKTVSFELHTVDNEMLNEFDWIAINDTLDGHFSSIYLGNTFRLTFDEFIEDYSGFFEPFAKDGEFQQLKRNIKQNVVNMAPNGLKDSVEGYREQIGRTNEIGKLKELIKQIESAYGLKNGAILNKYKKRMN
jgi:hypothetical protein